MRDRPVTVTEAPGAPLARVTEYAYDLAGRQTEARQYAASDSAQVFTPTYTYDLLGRRTAIGGNRADPLSYTYDAGGRLATQTDALGRVTSYTYDAQDRVTAVRVNGALVQSSEYDVLGNLLSQSDGAGNLSHYRYDELGRPTHVSIALSSTEAAPASWWTMPAYVLQETSYDVWSQPLTVTRYTVTGSGVAAATTRTTYDAFGRKLTEGR